MIKLDESKDMRLKILLYLEKEDFALEQIPANTFLSKLETINNVSDLGTIRRSLQDLKKEEFIIETNDANIIYSYHLCSSKAQLVKFNKPDLIYHLDWGNPERFVKGLENAPEIPKIYLGITLKGKAYLTDRRNSESNQELITHSIDDLSHRKGMRPIEKWILYIGFVLGVAGFIKSVLG